MTSSSLSNGRICDHNPIPCRGGLRHFFRAGWVCVRCHRWARTLAELPRACPDCKLAPDPGLSITVEFTREEARALLAGWPEALTAKATQRLRRAVQTAEPPVHVPALLAEAFGVSRSEARRAQSLGGVFADDEPLTWPDVPSCDLAGKTLRLGKRREVELDEEAHVTLRRVRADET